MCLLCVVRSDHLICAPASFSPASIKSHPGICALTLPPFLPNTIYILKPKQAFLKDCLSHASSDPRLFETMTTVLSSQMFERFIEERQTESDHPQIKVMGREEGREEE